MKYHCPDHPEAALEEDSRAGDLICTECGLVVGDRIIDVRAEWRCFGDDGDEGRKDPSRVGAAENSLFNDGGLGTALVELSSESNKDLIRAQQRIETTNNNRDIATRRGVNAIRELAEKLHLVPVIRERAMKLYKEVVIDGNRMGGPRSVELKATVCIFFACSQLKAPRTVRELCQVTRMPAVGVNRCIAEVRPFFTKQQVGKEGKGIAQVEDEGSGTRHNRHCQPMPAQQFMPITPVDLLPRICATLSVRNEVLENARRIAEKITKLGLLRGRTPQLISAVSLYVASRHMPSAPDLKEISEAATITGSNLRNACKLISPHFVKLILR